MPQRDAIDYVERAKVQVDAAIEVAPTQSTHYELVELQHDLDEISELLEGIDND